MYYMRSEFSDYMLIKREESDIIKSECVRIPLNILMAQGNRHIVDSDSKVDNNVVRQKVMDSYQDMLSGKGRDYKVFFAELESRYNGK